MIYRSEEFKDNGPRWHHQSTPHCSWSLDTSYHKRSVAVHLVTTFTIAQ